MQDPSKSGSSRLPPAAPAKEDQKPPPEPTFAAHYPESCPPEEATQFEAVTVFRAVKRATANPKDFRSDYEALAEKDSDHASLANMTCEDRCISIWTSRAEAIASAKFFNRLHWRKKRIASATLQGLHGVAVQESVPCDGKTLENHHNWWKSQELKIEEIFNVEATKLADL